MLYGIFAEGFIKIAYPEQQDCIRMFALMLLNCFIRGVSKYFVSFSKLLQSIFISLKNNPDLIR
jgi:hypothetical protein